MIITDSGVHVWGPFTEERPLLPGRVPHLPEPLETEDFLGMMDEAGVHRAILVPPSWPGDYNDYCLNAAAAYPDRFAVMGRVTVEDPDAPAVVERWKNRPGMLGVRLTLHHEWDEGWVRDGTLDWFWAAAERLEIPVMMNAPTILPDLASVAERHPSLPLIIDHMGLRKGTKDDAVGPGLDHVVALARYANVSVKLTQVPNRSTETYPYRNMHDHVKRLLDSFGPRRTFWGSEVSVLLSKTDCSYAQNLTLFTEEMDFLSGEDLEWVMGRGLAEALPWPVEGVGFGS